MTSVSKIFVIFLLNFTCGLLICTNAGRNALNNCFSSGSFYFYHVPIPDSNDFSLCHASSLAFIGTTLLSSGHNGLSEVKATAMDS